MEIDLLAAPLNPPLPNHPTRDLLGSFQDGFFGGDGMVMMVGADRSDAGYLLRISTFFSYKDPTIPRPARSALTDILG